MATTGSLPCRMPDERNGVNPRARSCLHAPPRDLGRSELEGPWSGLGYPAYGGGHGLGRLIDKVREARSRGETASDPDQVGERAQRRAARQIIGRYHEEQLRVLLERVREGFARLDAGEIDAFELDEPIHRYKRSARELWKLCGQSGSGWLTAARTLEHLRARGEARRPPTNPAAPRRRR